MGDEERPCPTVKLVDVSVGYQPGREVISSLDLTLKGPGIVHLVGRNGAGKSTFLELCSGYLRPWRGRVLLNGAPATDPDVRRSRRICRTEVALYPHMTVRDHLAFGARCTGSEIAEGIDRASRHGLDSWLDENANTLSTGNARKLWFVMCTLGSFDIAVIDEPFNGIDVDSADVVVSELSVWAHRTLVLLISHAPPAALPITRTVELHSATHPDQRTNERPGTAAGVNR